MSSSPPRQQHRTSTNTHDYHLVSSHAPPPSHQQQHFQPDVSGGLSAVYGWSIADAADSGDPVASTSEHRHTPSRAMYYESYPSMAAHDEASGPGQQPAPREQTPAAPLSSSGSQPAGLHEYRSALYSHQQLQHGPAASSFSPSVATSSASPSASRNFAIQSPARPVSAFPGDRRGAPTHPPTRPAPLQRTESLELFQQVHGLSPQPHNESGSGAGARSSLPTLDTDPATMNHSQQHQQHQRQQRQHHHQYDQFPQSHAYGQYSPHDDAHAWPTGRGPSGELYPHSISSSSASPTGGLDSITASSQFTSPDATIYSHHPGDWVYNTFPPSVGMTAPLGAHAAYSSPHDLYNGHQLAYKLSYEPASTGWASADYYPPTSSASSAALLSPPLQLTSNYFSPHDAFSTMSPAQPMQYPPPNVPPPAPRLPRSTSDYADHSPLSNAGMIPPPSPLGSASSTSNVPDVDHHQHSDLTGSSNMFSYTAPATQLGVPPFSPPRFDADAAHAVNSAIFSSSHTFSYAPPTISSGVPGPESASSGSRGPFDASTPSPPVTSESVTPNSSFSGGGILAAPALLAAAAERKRLKQERQSSTTGNSPNSAGSDSTPSIIPGAKPGLPKKTSQPGSLRPCIEVPVACGRCFRPLAKISLRGTAIDRAKEEIVATGTYDCLDCVPVLIRPKVSTAIREGEATYADTLSAAVDRLEGLSFQDSPSRGSSRAGSTTGPSSPTSIRTTLTSSGVTATSKKRVKEEERLLTCDVCRREVGSGELQCSEKDLTTGKGKTINFSVEVLCTSCDRKYLRCSDCGGGGGMRGVGRWRAKEMFPGGRRTCQLSHVRQGALNEMTYDVWPITSIPPDQIDELVAICRELYIVMLLATLAVPDMMESPSPLASTFDVVLLLATDSWPMFEALIRENIEPQTSTRRYIALRWISSGQRRRKVGAEPNGGRRNAPTLSKDGRTLGGFILGEQDLLLGSCHIALTMPSGSGESYDAGSRLMHSMFRHIQNDIASINAMRARQGEQLLPALMQAWTLHMIKRDSRMMNRMETKRGFVTLEEYLATYDDANEHDFAPHRPVYLPTELLKGWQCFVKRITDNDDWLVTTTRRSNSAAANSSY